MEEDECGTDAVEVGGAGGEENDDEGEEVRGCGEGLGAERGVAELVDYGGEEDRHGGKGDVTGKEHCLGNL